MQTWVRCLDLLDANNNRGWRARSGELDDELMGWRGGGGGVAVMILLLSFSLSTAPLWYTACVQEREKGLSWQVLKGDAIHAIACRPPTPILTLDHCTRAKGAALCCAGPNLISHAGSVPTLYHPDV